MKLKYTINKINGITINGSISRKYFHLFPFIIFLLLLSASEIPMDGSSAKMKNVIEYENAAMIPGTISKKHHNTIYKSINRYAPKAFPKLLKPEKTSSILTSWFLAIERKNLWRPNKNGPPIINTKRKPTFGMNVSEVDIK